MRHSAIIVLSALIINKYRHCTLKSLCFRAFNTKNDIDLYRFIALDAEKCDEWGLNLVLRIWVLVFLRCYVYGQNGSYCDILWVLFLFFKMLCYHFFVFVTSLIPTKTIVFYHTNVL